MKCNFRENLVASINIVIDIVIVILDCVNQAS